LEKVFCCCSVLEVQLQASPCGVPREALVEQNSRRLLIGRSASFRPTSLTNQGLPALRDNFPHVGSPNSHQPLVSISPPAIATSLQLFSLDTKRLNIPPQDVQERPPTEHARRRRPLCHEQSRRSECTSACPNPTPAPSTGARTLSQSHGADVREAQLSSYARCMGVEASTGSLGRDLLSFAAHPARSEFGLANRSPPAKCRTRRFGHPDPHIRRCEGFANRGLVHSRAENPRCPGGVQPCRDRPRSLRRVRFPTRGRSTG
jgi:hypothetical protein